MSEEPSPPHPLVAVVVALAVGAIAASRVGYGLIDQPSPWRSDLLREDRHGWVALIIDPTLHHQAGEGIERYWGKVMLDQGLRCPELRREGAEVVIRMAEEEPPMAVLVPLDMAFPGRQSAAGPGRRPRGPNEGKAIAEGPYVPQEQTALIVRELSDRARTAFGFLDVAPEGDHTPEWREAQRRDALQLVGGDERFLFRPDGADALAIATSIANWLCVPR
ncbi:MAG TPA: hypothetical protein PKA64_18585 [Myxococcota bacterium]|nr:hypothetical protein [Myxococcota bacterium]